MFNDAKKEFRLCLVLQDLARVRDSGTTGAQSTVRHRRSSLDAAAPRREGTQESYHEESTQPRQEVLSN